MPITNNQNDKFLRQRLVPLKTDDEIQFREDILGILTDKDRQYKVRDFPDIQPFGGKAADGNNANEIWSINNVNVHTFLRTNFGELPKDKRETEIEPNFLSARKLFILADLMIALAECVGMPYAALNTPRMFEIEHFVFGKDPADGTKPNAYDNMLLYSLFLLHRILKANQDALVPMYAYLSDFEPIVRVLNMFKAAKKESKFRIEGITTNLVIFPSGETELQGEAFENLVTVLKMQPSRENTMIIGDVPMSRVRAQLKFRAPKYDKAAIVKEWGLLNSGGETFEEREYAASQKSTPQTAVELFNFNEHLSTAEDWQLRVLRRRYRNYNTPRVQGFDDLPSFCNHTYFPIVIDNNGTIFAAFVAVVYSSFPVPEQILRHGANYRALQIPGTSTSVMVDFGVINEGDTNAIKALTAAFIHANPKSLSYISFCTSISITGASMGLATAMAICGCPYVAATGYISSMDITIKDDLIGHIDLLDVKAKLAAREKWGIICSHTDIVKVLKGRNDALSMSMLYTSAMMNASSIRMKMVPKNHVFLGCTSLTEAIEMSILFMKANSAEIMKSDQQSILLQNSQSAIANVMSQRPDAVGKAVSLGDVGNIAYKVLVPKKLPPFHWWPGGRPWWAAGEFDTNVETTKPDLIEDESKQPTTPKPKRRRK